MTYVLALMLAAADGGPGPLMSPLFRALSEAHAVVELELSLDPTTDPTRAFQSSLQRPLIRQVLAARGPLAPPPSKPLRWDLLRSCAARLAGRRSVSALATVSPEGVVRPLPLATFGLGLALEETTFDALKAAIVEAFGWAEERMRAVPAQRLWGTQRSAVRSENPVLRHLAAELLRQVAPEVLDEEWGPAGSATRAAAERDAELVPRCTRP